MSHPNKNGQTPVLKTAWQRYAQFDAAAVVASAWHLRLRWWVIVLGLLATLLAVLADTTGQEGALGRLLGIGLIVAPIAASAVAALAGKFQQGERWLALRSGAEEIIKEIFLYRTVLQLEADRDRWLDDRLANIQRRVHETIGGDVSIPPYAGPLPPYHNPADPHSDPGFTNLLAEDYLQIRLQDQLQWHIRSAARLRAVKARLQLAVFAFGGLGTLLAGLANIPGLESLSVWVAVTTALAAAVTSWLELRRLESTGANYSRLIMELNLVLDHWHGLPVEKRSGDEFFRLVVATERVLWSQHNQFVSEMRKAVSELRGEPADTLAKVVDMPAPAAIDQAVLTQALLTARQAQAPAEKKPALTPRPGSPHALALLPAGRQRGPDGRWLDFDSIYQHLLKPALIKAGFQPHRAGAAALSGDILADTFQELLLADLVVADLSLDSADAFYELGVRHALRRRGLLHIQVNRPYQPFSIFKVQTLPYHCNDAGKPDPAQVQADINTLAAAARSACQAGREQGQSPVYNLLDGLAEPDRTHLSTPQAAGYWAEYHRWQEWVNLARRQSHLGDILLLTEEVSNPLIRERVIGEAAQILSDLGQHALALEQYRRGLALNPANPDFQRAEAFELGRLGQTDAAIAKLDQLTTQNPTDAEATAFLGRLYKDMWRVQWQHQPDSRSRQKAAAEAVYLLDRAAGVYLHGFSQNPRHYYSGINAVTLSLVRHYLHRLAGSPSDPAIETARQQLPALIGAVKFSLAQATRRSPHDFWVLASQADMAMNTAKEPAQVAAAYRQALTLADKNSAGIPAVLEQLHMLEALGFRPAFVNAAVTVLRQAAAPPAPRPADMPAQVFLFSGHMIDQPNRASPRFPAGMETEARQKINQALDRLNARAGDLVITAGAACGGDILFLEACLQRRLRAELHLPFPDAEFIARSVSFAGHNWVERFHQIRQHPHVTVHYQPERLGPAPDGDDAFSRNNRWALYTAMGYGLERVRLVALWNGQGGDGPGGTGHMVQEVGRLGGVVVHLDTTQFDYWRNQPAR